MTESAYSIFKRPTFIDKGEPFLEAYFERFQGRVHYTPNLAQEINLSRNQRQLIADKGSFDGVKGSRIRPHPLSWMQASGTFRAALIERCFRYLDCFYVGLAHFRRFNRASRADIQSGPSIKAVYLSSEYRGDNVPYSPYQPHSGSYPAGSCGQKVSSRALITALQTSKGSGVERDEMTFIGQGLAYPDTT